MVTWAREHFDRVLLVFLVRNALDQAISRVVAAETGIFHITDPAFLDYFMTESGARAALSTSDDLSGLTQ